MTQLEPLNQNAGMVNFGHYLTIADRICKTAMVPTSLRNRPDEVLAVMLYGAELGIGPMQALQQINFISGKPSISAELMRALILQKGHQFILEISVTVATARVKRKDWSEWQEVTFTIDDAKRANLGVGDGWKKYPDQMLSARVTSKAARMFFADVISGMSYTPEEISEFAAETTDVPKLGATEEILRQIYDGVQMLDADEKVEFRQWWKDHNFPKIEELLQPEAELVYRELVKRLEAITPDEEENTVEANLDLSEAITEAFGEVVEVEVTESPVAPLVTNPQMGKIRALIGKEDLEAKLSEILKREVHNLSTITKSEASLVIQTLA